MPATGDARHGRELVRAIGPYTLLEQFPRLLALHGLAGMLNVWVEATQGDNPEAWLFPSENSATPLRRDNVWRRSTEPKLKKPGLQWADFQVMRRTLATLSKQAGVDAHTRSAQMGNTVDVNENEYAVSKFEVQRGPANRPKRAVLYTRVSTAKRSSKGAGEDYEQDPAIQELPLKALIDQRGWQLKRVYSDGASGAKQRRPGLHGLMKDVRRGEIVVVVVWRFDRFARSVKQLVDALEEFRSLGLDFVSHQEALDTSTPMGKAMFTVIAAMAELERGVVRERVIAGLEYARREGTRSGQPIGRPKAIFRRDEVVELRAAGLSWRQIGQRLGVGTTAARRAHRTAPDVVARSARS